MPTTNRTGNLSVDYFTKDAEVVNCLKQLEEKYGPGGERLVVSDVLDREGHQYVHLVQKGGGVLGVALVGYTYILEKMGIRFIRLAGTSAGAINTALMTVIGTEVSGTTEADKKVKGNKKAAKSEEVLKRIIKLNFFDLVDGHPAARAIIKTFITSKDFGKKISKWITGILIAAIALPVLDFICLGLQHQYPKVSLLTKALFVATGFYYLILSIVVFYLVFLVKRLKDSGFGINPGDYFYDWIKEQLKENHVQTVTQLLDVASTPVDGIYLREGATGNTSGLDGDVTFISSEIVTKNKIEFPRMWNLFKNDKDELQPAGFIRASMSIPIFFESYFINNIPCTDSTIKEAWKELGENDPPSTARFVDGGILSNFPINLFYNPNITTPRLPSFGIDLDDEKDPKDVFNTKTESTAGDNNLTNNAGKDSEKWSLGGYIGRLFNTVRFYYDKDFLIKNAFFKQGIGVIPLKGYGWLNFFLDDNAKREMFVLGAKAACKFLLHDFDWNAYKQGRITMQENLQDKRNK